MPLIVLEGADGCGKTTLANALMDRGNAHYIHATYRFPSRMTLYHLSIIRSAIKHLRAGQTVILDRWWPSELIYGKTYRDQHEPIENLRMLHRIGLRHGVTYVLCHRESREKQFEVFKKLKGERAEMYEVSNKVSELHDQYQTLWDSQSEGQEARWLKYSCDRAIQDKNYLSFMINTITQCAKWYNMLRKRNDEMVDHSSGSLSGKYIMVGDRVNPTYRALDIPWVGFRGSSVSMTVALRELGRPEHHFMWTNANGPGSHPKLLQDYLKIGSDFRKVVAMGDVARQFCESAGRCDIAMPHPAYLTRFHSQAALTDTLRKVLT